MKFTHADNQRFRLVFNANHQGYGANECAAFNLTISVALVSSGKARIDESEPVREAVEAAVRAHKQAPSVRWEFFLCQPRDFQGR